MLCRQGQGVSVWRTHFKGWSSWTKPRRPHQTGPPGLVHDSPRTPNVHTSGARRFKHHQKFHEKTPRERKKKEHCGGGRKKSKFWPTRRP